MKVTTTSLPQPPLWRASPTDPLAQYLLQLQLRTQFNTVDSSASGGNIALPPAGLNRSTGQSQQNFVVTYQKISADANDVTIQGGFTGDQTLAKQGDSRTYQSDGTNWYLTAAITMP